MLVTVSLERAWYLAFHMFVCDVSRTRRSEKSERIYMMHEQGLEAMKKMSQPSHQPIIHVGQNLNTILYPLYLPRLQWTLKPWRYFENITITNFYVMERGTPRPDASLI